MALWALNESIALLLVNGCYLSQPEKTTQTTVVFYIPLF